MKATPENIINFSSAFEEDIYLGLTAYPKYLSSQYIYDEKGDKLFQEIMKLPEYYLTNCEKNILETNTPSIADSFNSPKGFDLIELGAGDGVKTKILLRHLAEKNYDFNYMPIDISEHVLQELETSLKSEMPSVNIQPQQGTYFKALEKLADYSQRKKVILVLGSNIGNLLHDKAIEFLKNIRVAMNPEDMLFMGFDQKKHPRKIVEAYSDASGVTSAFNKNLLYRINKEVDANFNPEAFLHWESYNPESGTAKSFLVSKKNQKVQLEKLGISINFEAWESIHTEISQKYDDTTVKWLADEAGLKLDKSFSDTNNFYKNYIFRRS